MRVGEGSRGAGSPNEPTLPEAFLGGFGWGLDVAYPGGALGVDRAQVLPRGVPRGAPTGSNLLNDPPGRTLPAEATTLVRPDGTILANGTKRQKWLHGNSRTSGPQRASIENKGVSESQEQALSNHARPIIIRMCHHLELWR